MSTRRVESGQRIPREGYASIESRTSWHLAWAALVIAAVAFGAMNSIPILLKPVARDWDVGAGSAALVHTSALFGAAVGGVAMGRVFDRLGFFWMGIAGAVCLASGLVLASLSGSLLTLHLTYALMIGGLGQGALFAPLTAALSQWFDRNRGLAIAMVASGQNIGGIGIPPLMRWAAEHFGWRATLATYGLCAVAILVVCMLAFRRRPPAQQPPTFEASGSSLFQNGSISPNGLILLLGMEIGLLNFGTFLAMGHMTAYGEERSFHPAAAAVLLSAMLGFGLLPRLFVGRLARRIGTYSTVIVSAAFQVIGICWLVLAETYIQIAAGAILIGVGYGGYLPAFMVLVREFFPGSEAGRRIAELNFFAFASAGAGTYCGGWARDVSGGYQLPFMMAAVAGVMGVLLLVKRRTQFGAARAASSSPACRHPS